jgi:hypothetical protein
MSQETHAASRFRKRLALRSNGWSRPSHACATAVAYPKMTGFTEANNA